MNFKYGRNGDGYMKEKALTGGIIEMDVHGLNGLDPGGGKGGVPDPGHPRVPRGYQAAGHDPGRIWP